MNTRKTFTLRLEEKLLAKLQIASSKNKRSINNQLEVLAEKFISDFEKENGEIVLDDVE